MPVPISSTGTLVTVPVKLKVMTAAAAGLSAGEKKRDEGEADVSCFHYESPSRSKLPWTTTGALKSRMADRRGSRFTARR
jgi:hypothetical protein